MFNRTRKRKKVEATKIASPRKSAMKRIKARKKMTTMMMMRTMIKKEEKKKRSPKQILTPRIFPKTSNGTRSEEPTQPDTSVGMRGWAAG